MALFFSRDVKVYIKQDADTMWQIPVLDGYSFSQSMNTSEVTLSEMTLSDGSSRRGRVMFNDSLSASEWSFDTYARPFAAEAATGMWEDTADLVIHSVEEPLLANFMAPATWTPPATSASSWDAAVTSDTTTTGSVFDFLDSDKPALGTFTLYFVFDEDTNPQVYRIDEAAVSSMSLDFDIEGIATWNISGMGKKITDDGASVPTATNPTITEGIINSSGAAITSNFIRNRLTEMTITAADTTNFPGESSNGVYNIPLTGGSISFENNISYLVPESLGIVNQPLEHVTGSRALGASFTAYLGSGAGTSGQFFKDLVAASEVVRNSFDVTFIIGGDSSTTKIAVNFPQAHFEVPTISVEDVISIESNLTAVPSTLDTPDEASLTYHGVAPSA